MKILKNYKYLLELVVFLLVVTLLLTIINLLFPINNSLNNMLCLLAISIFSLLTGLKKGKLATEKGYIVGCKTGFMIIILLFILNSIFISFKIPIKEVLYYLIIFTSVVLGSIIGINKVSRK